ncbi:MAG: hypothetical protein HY513_04125 [Candidatus Aenigmarchaeota archaeon]|nr:hypothetical protein [Candidatus Aenigmarchaeota archaeon]
MVLELKTRKIGNSIGVIFPNEIIKKEHIRPNQTIGIQIIKKADLRDIFGLVKTKQTAQEIKDELRKGWD